MLTVDKAIQMAEFLLKDLNDSLNMMISGNMPVQKYWEYVGRVMLSKQMLGRMGHQVKIIAVLKEEGK
jgi:hypothetical protein